MNAMKVLKLAQEYQDCPECGNNKVGNGEGKVLVDGDSFHRSCKCGWETTIKE